MKIPIAIRRSFQDQFPAYETLRERVQKLIEPIRRRKNWYFIDRLKSDVSFAQKIESGRFFGNFCIEDFYATTIVVPDLTEIENVISELESILNVSYRRPRDFFSTKMKPNEFRFDDLRLYCKIGEDEMTGPHISDDLLFEVQVKTFLQHAWGIATHKLVYKSDRVSWPMQRVASQIKAMLEHIEISIFEADALAKNQFLNRSDIKFDSLSKIIVILEAYFSEEKLPLDRIRLAENLLDLCVMSDTSVEDMERIVQSAREIGRGPSLEDQSPYGSVFCAIVEDTPDKLRSICKAAKERKRKIVLPEPLPIPDELKSQYVVPLSDRR
jgi:ppGpp synthetase/RelA/SpoT-type nucleotidyltranferase